MLRRVLPLLVLALVVVPSAAAAPTTPLPSCSPSTPTRCVVAVERNGVAVPYPGSAGDPYVVSALTWTDGPTRRFNFTVSRRTGTPFTLDPGDTWTVQLNTGATYPEETFARGRNVIVSRGGSAAGGYTVTFTMRPVRMATTDDGCAGSGACGGSTSVAPNLFPGYLDGWTNDLDYVTDADDRAAMRGFDLATNADWVSTPLQLDFATRSIVLDVANRHFEPDGVTPFVGSAEFRLPNAMLRRLYLVDDPSSLTASAFRIRAGSGPAPTVGVTVAPTSVHVAISNITFSRRRLQITGDMRPLAPRSVRAARTSATRARIRFAPARARGSKVRGYTATCRARGHVVRASSAASPLTVSGLGSARYTCSVRAKSRAGLGRAAAVALAAR